MFKVAVKNFLIWLVILASFLSNADSCSEFQKQISPTFQTSLNIYEINSSKVLGSSQEMLKTYKRLSNELKKLEGYREKIVENFSSHCVEPGSFYTREMYYFDDEFKVLITYMGEPPDISKRFIEEYMYTSRNWIEVLERLSSESEIKLNKIGLAIKSKVEDERKSEKVREKSLSKRESEMKELESLVGESVKKKKANDKKESKAEVQKTLEMQSENIPDSNAEDRYTNMMANYGTIIGRATACGIDPTREIQQVGVWMDRWFNKLEVSQKMRSMYLSIFMQGTEHHMNQQKQGNSPDTCISVAQTFKNMRWP